MLMLQLNDLIFDRTETDKSQAAAILDAYKSSGNWNALSTAETNQLERGTYTLNSLNRVESWAYSLSQLLTEAGYNCEYRNSKTPSSASQAQWQYGDTTYLPQWQQYIANVQALCDAYYVMPDTPELPQPEDKLDIEGANAIERTLNDIYTLIQAMQASYRKCGTFASGNNAVRLPLKRS